MKHTSFTPDARGAVRAWSLLVVLASGLLTYFAPHDEAYAGADYGISLLAALGAASCLGYLASRLSLRLDLLPRLLPAASGLSPSVVVTGGLETGEDWPLLVALLFGLFLMILAGLGGWV